MKIALIFILSTFGLQIMAQKVRLPNCRNKFIVIAHRGDHTEMPENTIASFEQAILHTADYVEIDLRTTKDGELVIMHDATVDRMTNGKGKISDLTFGQVQQLDITDKVKISAETYKIPSFSDVLKTCKGKINIYLDFKDASVQQTYKIIKKYGMEHQVIVYINKPFQYTEWKKIAPAMPLMLSLPQEVKTKEDLDEFLIKNPVALLDGDYNDYTQAVIKAATEAGVPAWPDIQSQHEADNWDIALTLGFKGLQTDHPQALINYLVKKGVR